MTYKMLFDHLDKMDKWDYKNDPDQEAGQHGVSKETTDQMRVVLTELQKRGVPCPDFDVVGYGQAELMYVFGPPHEDDEELWFKQLLKDKI